MRHVAILTHRHGEFDRSPYWLRALSEVWQEQGIRISVVRGTQARPEADVAILHVDLTVVPPEYMAFARQYPIVLNGGVPDISKRVVSQNLVRRTDGYDGPVIVKSDRNCRGYPEARLAYLAAGRRWRKGSSRPADEYQVFDSVREVPARVWKTPDLVVERFLPERRNGHYCIRTWLFFGDQERHTLFYASDPLVKGAGIVGSRKLGKVPEAIRQRRRDLKFDFGKFDYTVGDDGRPVLFDANRTPAVGSFPRRRYLPIARGLAKGIDSVGPFALAKER